LAGRDSADVLVKGNDEQRMADVGSGEQLGYEVGDLESVSAQPRSDGLRHRTPGRDCPPHGVIAQTAFASLAIEFLHCHETLYRTVLADKHDLGQLGRGSSR